MDYGFIGTFILYTTFIVVIPVITEKAILSEIEFNRKVYTILAIGFPCLLATFRGMTGTDTGMYKNAFDILSQGADYNNRWVDFEIGYIWLNRICGFFGLSFEWLLFFVQFITFGLAFLAIRQMKKSIDVKLAMYIYMVSFVFSSYNIMRQAIAVAICLYGFTLLNEKKTICFCLVVLVAMLFHRSALICLGVVFVKFILENKNMKIVQISAILIVLYLVFNRYILAEIVYFILNNNYYASYFSRDVETDGSVVNFFIQYAPCLVIMFFGYRTVKDDKKLSVYYWLLLVGYCLLILGKLTGTQVQRIAFYFTCLDVFVFPYIIKQGIYIMDKKIPTKFVSSLLQIYLFVFFYYQTFYRGYADLVPYLGIWKR